MKFIDDKSKNVKWWNRNYFYAGTIFIIVLNILIFAFANCWQEKVFNYDELSLNNNELLFVYYFFGNFSHGNWQHVLLNMICFAGVGLYLERKTGSFGIIGLVIFAAFFAGNAKITISKNENIVGFSGVNYFLYACIIIDYLFSFRKSQRNKTNIILGAIILALIYLTMCFNGGTTSFGFEWYPYDLISNSAHSSGFIAGVVFVLASEFIILYAENNAIKNLTLK